MSRVNKYLKIAKDVEINPSDKIDSRIIDKISNLTEDDKKLVDESFLEYVRKNNSRLFLFFENIRNNPERFAFAIGAMAVTAALFYIFVKKFVLPSPEKD